MSTLSTVRRITVVTHDRLEDMLVTEFAKLGAKGYTAMDCRGRGEHELLQDVFATATRVRIETIVKPEVADAIMNFLSQPDFSHQPITACVETVEVPSSMSC
jgi:nitrogen regulatory protein P-II 2